MKVLFVSSLALFGGTRFGGAKRLYYLAKELERHVDLRVLSFDGSREWTEAKAFPKTFRRQLHLPMPALDRGMSRLGFLPGVAGVISAHRNAIVAFLGRDSFDIVVLAYPIALAFLDADWPVPLGRRIYIEDDLQIERYHKSALGSWSPQRLMGLLRFWQCRIFFARHIQRLDRFICISPEEEALVRGYFPGVPTRILTYGLPLSEYPQLDRPEGPLVLGFIGNYGHTPNLDALRWLLAEIFPRMRQRSPGSRLIVAGTRFPSGLKPLCDPEKGVTVMEDIRELTEFYSRIGVFINPVRKGRGLRTKVVEAAAFGRPILSTRLGAEGLECLEMGRCETVEDFLSAFSGMSDGDAYGRTVQHNRNAIVQNFSIEALGRRLVSILEEVPTSGV